jgi:peroxiredoxin
VLFKKTSKMKKNTIYILYSLLFLGCNSDITNKKNVSDLESLQLKTSFVDLNENTLDLSVFKEGKTVISYWATWCRPCIEEMPSLKRAEEILEEYGYTFLLVSDETISKISNFKNDKNFDFNFLKSNKSFETLGVYFMPTTYIFDENGKIIETIVGAIEWDSEEMITKLKML